MHPSRKGTQFIAMETVYDNSEYAFGTFMQGKKKQHRLIIKKLFSKEQKYRSTTRILA